MKYAWLLPALALGACTEFQQALTPAVAAPPAATAPTLDPTPPPPPPRSARTVEQFDTTTQEDRAEALAPVNTGGETRLGTTIASLGNPADPGIWLETPLVSALTPGSVKLNGKTVKVELRPSGGAAGSGSEISLAAMRLLNVPLTDLPTIEVFAN